jgi:hypothetical protein
MSLQNIITKTLSLDGRIYNQQITVESTSIVRKEVELAAAKTGTLTTRTDANTGTLTMTAGHGITTGAIVDIYWVVAGITYCHRNVTVGTVATNSVPIDSGIGTDLPAAATAVTVMVQTVVEFRFDGTDAKVIAATANAAGASVTFAGADNAEDWNINITQTGQVKEWYQGNGETNPVEGDVITQAFVTHGDSSGTKTVKLTLSSI